MKTDEVKRLIKRIRKADRRIAKGKDAASEQARKDRLTTRLSEIQGSLDRVKEGI